MSNVGAEAELVQRFAQRGIGDGQQVLLGGILRALDPRGLLTQHAASPGTAAVALSRAHAVLHSRGTAASAQAAQPYEDRAFRIQIDAKDAVDRVCAFAASDQRLADAKSFLHKIVNDGAGKLKQPAQCRALAKVVDGHRRDFQDAIADLTAHAWQSPPSDECLAWIAAEAAALCLASERNYDLLLDDVHALLRWPDPIGGKDLVDVLLPAAAPFRVVVVVEGAAGLATAGRLMPAGADCVQFPVDGLPEKWAYGKAELAALATLVKERMKQRGKWAGGSSKAVLLTFRVPACDHGAAMLIGRRKAAELLDQYVAGHRLAELRLGEETLVCGETTGSTRRFAGSLSAPAAAKPLTRHWPPQLREGMRTAHIARSTQGLTASTGLCWATLEALGLKSKTQALAKTLSLQALRQQVTSAYQELRVAALGRHTAATSALASAEQRRAKVLREYDRATAEGRTVPPQLQEVEEACRKAVEARTRECAAAEAAFRQPLEVLDRWTEASGRGRIADVNRWLDVLAPPPVVPADLAEAISALDDLTRAVGGWAAHVVRTWQQRLSDTEATTEWIKEVEGRFKAALEWLYATRNTALHEGRFESETGTLDALGGRALVDLTLEVLGNWYQHASTRDQASKVVSDLGTRQKSILEDLEHKGARGLNLTHLTSPTSTGLDRP
ncbi:hypothetical protein [Streptomyces aureus]|uniref:hypothetical protein n=1 Tax=Streptomyces aureus TaxID=193461 RepID=UPI0005679FE1|nr:hypothetical protein [Streptomyces aureus]